MDDQYLNNRETLEIYFINNYLLKFKRKDNDNIWNMEIELKYYSWEFNDV